MQIRRKKKSQLALSSPAVLTVTYLILLVLIILYYQSKISSLAVTQKASFEKTRAIEESLSVHIGENKHQVPKTGDLLPAIETPTILMERNSLSYLNDDAVAFQTPIPSISIPKLRILASISSTGYQHFHHVEQQIDAFRDICEAGARIDVHLYTDILLPLNEADQLSGRTGCRNLAGSFSLTIHLKSPMWKFKFMDFHRKLFKDHLDDYDVFLHNEDDHLIRLSHIVAYLQETEILRGLVGDERLPDYSIGFVRYENKHVGKRSHRVSIDHGFQEDHMQLEIVDHPDIQGRYWRTPGYGMKYNYQGFYFATPELLKAWDKRPNCHFLQYPPKDFGPLHREFVNSGFLYHQAYCAVTQLIPLETMEDFNVWHMSQNKFNDKSQSTTTPLWMVYSAARQRVDIPTLHQNFIIVDEEIDPQKRHDIVWDVQDYTAYTDNHL